MMGCVNGCRYLRGFTPDGHVVCTLMSSSMSKNINMPIGCFRGEKEQRHYKNDARRGENFDGQVL